MFRSLYIPNNQGLPISSESALDSLRCTKALAGSTEGTAQPIADSARVIQAVSEVRLRHSLVRRDALSGGI